MKDDIIIYDIETKESFQQVGSRDPRALNISVIGMYSYNEKRLIGFREDELGEFWRRLESCKLLIGYNNHGFDDLVVSKYFPEIDKVPTLDIMEEAQNVLGFRLKLDNIAHATLGEGKSGDGLQAIKLYAEGKIDELLAYCLKDVDITKRIYDHALKTGVLEYSDMQGKKEFYIDLHKEGKRSGEPLNFSLF